MSGVKHDGGKDPWHLAPYDAFRAIVRVLAFGAKKYAPRNWEDGMAWSRVYDASMRHATAWWNREGVDADTGYSHLWHLGCCVCFLIAYEIRGTGTDDRPTPKAKEKPLIDQYAALGERLTAGKQPGAKQECAFNGKTQPGPGWVTVCDTCDAHVRHGEDRPDKCKAACWQKVETAAPEPVLCGFDHGKHYPGVNYACAKCHCTVGDELRPAGCQHWITGAPPRPFRTGP